MKSLTAATVILAFLAVSTATASPRSAAQPVTGFVRLLPASSMDGAGSFSPSTNRTGPASTGASPDPTSSGESSAIRGLATWCAPTPTRCQSWGGSAKLGAVPTFRYGDKPYLVDVCNRAGACVTVKVVSYCGCPGDRVIDLSPSAFVRLAPLSRGVIPVTVLDSGRFPAPTLPATDTEGHP